MTQEIIRPWPGPKPYREEDAKRFFGRKEEIARIRSKIAMQRLSLLLAGSGVGKTSLLQAGVLPQLRDLREQEPEAFGPAVLVRQWGRPGPPEIAFVQAVRNELESLGHRHGELGRTFRKDVQDLQEVPPPNFENLEDPYDVLDAAVGYVYRLAEATGKLILIVDQAEELLGSGLERRDPDREQRALDLFASIFRRVKECHLMLSLREEYRARLSPLARFVDGLDSRQSDIKPLPRTKVRDAITRAADQVPGVRLAGLSSGRERPVIDTIFEWLDGSTDDSSARKESVDLLRLQALLVEIFEHAREKHQEVAKERDAIMIDPKLLDDFQEEMVKEAGRELEPIALGQQALERYIDRALARQESLLTQSPNGLIRRLVVRMAPWLSSPAGFKRHNRQEDLIFNAIRSDLEILRATSSADDIRKALRSYPTSKQELIIEYDRSNPEETVSGWGWDYDQDTVGSRLAQAGFEALKILQDEEILKGSEGGEGKVYELIHDGFGPALHEWADRRRKDIGDTLASIVSQCGENFLWNPRMVEEREIYRVRWLGCNLNDFRLTDVIFKNCDLRGTIFLDCILENCQFVDCELDGLVFKGGSWQNVQWDNCGGRSALFASMSWKDAIAFKDCSIENTSFEEVSLNGALTAENCSLRFAQLQSTKKSEGAAELNFLECDLTNALIEDFDDAKRRGCLGENTVLEVYEKSPMGRRSEQAATKVKANQPERDL